MPSTTYTSTHRAYYVANREQILAKHRAYARGNPTLLVRLRERRALAHAFIDAAMAGGCVDCGNKNLSVLQLDHVRGEKHLPVTRMDTYPFSKLFAEIEKCETRCANCHQLKTRERRRSCPQT